MRGEEEGRIHTETGLVDAVVDVGHRGRTLMAVAKQTSTKTIAT